MPISLKNTLQASDEVREILVNPSGFGDVLIDTGDDGVLLSGSILQIPAVWSAVDFLSGTLAALPLNVYLEDNMLEKQTGFFADFVGKTPRRGFTSYDWRYAMWKNVFTLGRSISYIERGRSSGRPRRLYWELDPKAFTVTRENGEVVYTYNDGTGSKRWTAADVLDIVWARGLDQLGHLSPLNTHTKTFKMAFAFEAYQQKFAETHGIPPFVLQARWNSPNAVKEGIREFLTAVRLASKNGDLAVPIGRDMEVSALGTNPEQGKVLETQQFIVRQFCRVYGIPPIYLHDLDHMTFSNAEHQALNLMKYTLLRWATQLEGQIDLKLLPGKMTAKHDMDALLRGNYKERIEGHSIAIQSGQLTPNEARGLEGRPAETGGDELFIQSATLPIRLAGKNKEQNDGKQGIQGDEPKDGTEVSKE